MTLTKHEQILNYIAGLAVGTKVSVRQIAKELDVSDGTAYRAIKEAEVKGLVSSIPKVGTVRIEKKEEKDIKDLTLGEIARIVEATVVQGQGSLEITFKKFVIGASTVSGIEKLVDNETLFMVGNRETAQLKALELGANLLVVGGFSISAAVLKVAQAKRLTVMSTPYEAFAVTTMINRALHERLKEKDVVLVRDVMVQDFKVVDNQSTVGDWHRIAKKYGHSRLPVIDSQGRVLGMVTAIDVAGISMETPVDLVMTDTATVTADASVSHVARVMTWDGIELVPVVDNKHRIIGVVSRQDIINAYQHVQKQPHVVDTIDNIVLSGFVAEDIDEGVIIRGEVSDFMTNEFGAVSMGTLVTLMNSAAYIAVRKRKKLNFQTENFSFSHYLPIEITKELHVKAEIKYLQKRNVRLFCQVYCKSGLVAEALVSGRVVD